MNDIAIDSLNNRHTSRYINSEILNVNYWKRYPLSWIDLDLEPLNPDPLQYIPIHLNDDITTHSLIKTYKLSCCMTVYNESGKDFANSLTSLLSSYYQFCSNTSASENRPTMLVCVMVDGMNSISESLGDYAEHLGIFLPSLKDPHADAHVFTRQIDVIEFLNQKPGVIDPIGKSASSEKCTVDLLFCVKEDNKGKRDSHWLYFNHLCAWYPPEYCLQIDVGVCPEIDALEKLTHYLDDNEAIAATAAKSLIPPPNSGFNILQSWQYTNFVIERFVSWSAELLVGFLSVMPGQIHLLRWKAVAPKTYCDAIDSSQAPLTQYFKEVSTMGVLETNMYLAEDRILGVDLVYNRHKTWNLGYTMDAIASVDPCGDWSELLKQRRRWICGGLACKIYLLKKYFSNRDASLPFRATLKRDLSILFFLICGLFEWFSPAISLAIFGAVYALAHESVPMTSLVSPLLTTGFMLSILLFCVQFAIALSGKLNKTIDQIISISLYTQAIVFTFMLASIGFNSVEVYASSGVFYLAIGCILLLLLVVTTHSVHHATKFIRSLPATVSSALFIGFFLHIYAICNMNDTSWGTKGLQKPLNHKLGTTEKSSKLFRLLTILLLISTNGVFLWSIIDSVAEIFIVQLYFGFFMLCLALCATGNFYKSRLLRA